LNHGLALSLVGALLALDYAMVGQFMISQPLVVGGIFGACLGDTATGLLVGALIQLMWISILPVGAYVPADHTVTGGITVALTLMLTRQYGFPLGPSMVLALAVSIPAGVLSGKLDVAVRHFNSRLAQSSERVAERHGSAGISGLNLAGLIPAFFRNFILYFLWLLPGAGLLVSIYRSLPASVLRGMDLAFWLLPAISFAVILEIIAKDDIRWWVGGAFALGVLLAVAWPGHLLLLFSASAAVGAAVAWRRRGW
jgi:mannose/fructose/N-acetylgalactosamine-specific phosphotransferase system component IIC